MGGEDFDDGLSVIDRPVTIGSLALNSTIKLGACAITMFWVPVGTVFGILALAHVMPVTINTVPTYGVRGLVAGVLIGAFIALLSTAIFALGALIAVNVPWIARRPLTVLRRR